MKAHTLWFLRESRTARRARGIWSTVTYFAVLFGAPLVAHYIARGGL
jgi:hypothetical protein